MLLGTCLTTGELRQVLSKLDNVDWRKSTDHALHSYGVRLAGERNLAGKLLKALDKRLERTIRRFSKFRTPDDLRRCWNEAVDEGDVSGAYWAVMSHPMSNRALLQDVFYEVHMLSHLVGSSSRLDLARLRKLQLEADAKDEKIARQQQRLKAASDGQSRLRVRIEELEAALLRAQTVASETGRSSGKDVEQAGLLDRLEVASHRTNDLAARLAGMERELKAADEQASLLADRNRALEHEIELLEAEVESPGLQVDEKHVDGGRSLLYAGGRPNLFDRLRALAKRRNIDLLIHDGGIEDNLSLLPALVGQAGAVLFPVDCISHSAAGMAKRLCRESGKAYVPLRSASIASFMAAIAQPMG